MARTTDIQEFSDMWLVKSNDSGTGVNSMYFLPKKHTKEEDLPEGTIDRSAKTKTMARWRAESLPDDHPHKARALDRINRIEAANEARKDKQPKAQVIKRRRIEVLKNIVDSVPQKPNTRGV